MLIFQFSLFSKNYTDLPFKKNDKIFLTVDSRNFVYFNYTCFFNFHPKFKAKWAYKCYPDITHKFKIKGIYKQKLEDFDTNKYIIVIEDTVTMQIYLIGEKGVLCSVENKF